MRAFNLLALLGGAAVLSIAPAQAQTIDQSMIDALKWRQIGPANMSGRVTDVEGLPSPSVTFYVATAGGGVWKTTNNGVTFRPIFDTYGVPSTGDLAIAPSDSNILYLGTGENNPRNSVSYGDGLYKSTDGGATWKNMGLKKSFQIAPIYVFRSFFVPVDTTIIYFD